MNRQGCRTKKGEIMKKTFTVIFVFLLSGCIPINNKIENKQPTKQTVAMSTTEKRIYTDCINISKPSSKWESYTPDTKLCECTTKLFLSKASPEEIERALAGDWWEWSEPRNVCIRKLYTPTPLASPLEVYITNY